MSIAEIVESSGWKNFMAKLYGLGAAIVIVGALFKIQHWPGAGLMLTIGLLTEAVIFFFSAFEPLHEELDWTLVYPELAGMTDPDEMENFKDDMIDGKEARKLQSFDDLLNQSDINVETMNKLSTGLTSLSSTAAGLSDIADASSVSQEFVGNLQSASSAVSSMGSMYESSNEALKESVTTLAASYHNASEAINQSGANFQQMNASNTEFFSNLESLNRNLGSLNSSYELQLKNNEDYVQNTKNIFEGFNDMITNLEESVDETKHYKEAMAGLTDNIKSLNKVYGNMLAAMNINN